MARGELTPTEAIVARMYLEARTIPVPFCGCRLWLGAARSTGYGAANVLGRQQWDAHRLSYAAHIGPIPRGMLVCHRCDVKICTEPSHFFLGTKRDNADDASAKGLIAKVLTADLVREIRELSATLGYRRLSRRFGISRAMVRDIILRRKWRFV